MRRDEAKLRGRTKWGGGGMEGGVEGGVRTETVTAPVVTGWLKVILKTRSPPSPCHLTNGLGESQLYTVLVTRSSRGPGIAVLGGNWRTVISSLAVEGQVIVLGRERMLQLGATTNPELAKCGGYRH